eukprot:9493593-Pyramimonas_sp.AAC.1
MSQQMAVAFGLPESLGSFGARAPPPRPRPPPGPLLDPRQLPPAAAFAMPRLPPRVGCARPAHFAY